MSCSRVPYRVSASAIVAVLLFAYALWFRTHSIGETFFLYADQVRDWQIAMRPFVDLPLVGPPSQAGGHTAGPVYYWLLWAIARTIGPWTDYLPHAGGIGISLLQSAGDVILFVGLAYQLRSIALALAIVLAVATAGHDAAVSATIWNPPVAVALVKIALGLMLRAGIDGTRQWVAVSMLLWLAVQAHLTALPVAMALLLFGIGVRGRREAFRRAGIAVVVIAVLQIPWLVHQAIGDPSPDGSPMGQSILAVLENPLAMRPVESTHALLRALTFNSGLTSSAAAGAMLLMAGALALFVSPSGRALRAIAIGPLLCAMAIFAVWQGPLNENYWFLALAPSAAVCVAGWIAFVPDRVRALLVGVLVALVALAQPAQARIAWSSLRTPIYGALVRGARMTLASGYTVREVATSFSMPAGTDPAYVYSLLGGRLDSAATQRVVIAPSGAIRFEAR